MVMQIRDMLAVQMQMLTIGIFQGVCWAGQCGASPFKRFQSASGKHASIAENSSHLSEEEEEEEDSYLKNKQAKHPNKSNNKKALKNPTKQISHNPTNQTKPNQKTKQLCLLYPRKILLISQDT